MATALKAFFILPEGIVVYSLDNPNKGTDTYIYNAGSLERVRDPKMESYSEIDGLVSSEFGTKPVVVCYKDGRFEVLYAAPDKSQLMRSDGSIAQPSASPVTATSVIQVPNLELDEVGSDRVTALALREPSRLSLENYIKLSRPMMELVPPPVRPTVEVASTPNVIPADIQQAAPRSPSPRLTKVQKTPQQNTEVAELRQEIEQLKSIINAMNRRNYKIYPVDLPAQIKVKGVLAPVISVDEINKKMTGAEIERFEMDPMLQAYAGSHRSNNRLLTFYGKNGEVYHVRADYDAKTNKINPPK